MPSLRADPNRTPGLPSSGDVVGGKYRVERVLGRGGMGIVVEASHLHLREKVALKFLLPQMVEREDLVARFLREAQAAVRIKSEHVARVMDVGTYEGGAPYMVMEMLDGMDLGRVLRTRGPLAIEDAVDCILQACEAIAEAHSLGIVHRDLKPANLFLTHRADGSPLVKVLDFGISKLLSEGAAEQSGEISLTSAADVLGSPLYMSPEQIRTPKAVDGRADVWALGAILHKLVSGRSIWTAETAPAILAAIIADAPRPLRADRADVPAELEAAVLRCLDKNAETRVQTVGELAQLLLPFSPERSRAWRYASASHPSLSGPPGVHARSNTPTPVRASSPDRSISAAGASLSRSGAGASLSRSGAGASLSRSEDATPAAELPTPATSLPQVSHTGGAWATSRPPAGRHRALAVVAASFAIVVGAVALVLVRTSATSKAVERAKAGVTVAALVAASQLPREIAKAAPVAAITPPPAPSESAIVAPAPAPSRASGPRRAAPPTHDVDVLDERQ